MSRCGVLGAPENSRNSFSTTEQAAVELQRPQDIRYCSHVLPEQSCNLPHSTLPPAPIVAGTAPPASGNTTGLNGRAPVCFAPTSQPLSLFSLCAESILRLATRSLFPPVFRRHPSTLHQAQAPRPDRTCPQLPNTPRWGLFRPPRSSLKVMCLTAKTRLWSMGSLFLSLSRPTISWRESGRAASFSPKTARSLLLWQ